MLAYLVIREGTKWTDVIRLVPGRSVTIGRASTNQIVVQDERCSRDHAEIFFTAGEWTLRDLDSRNGTTLAGKTIEQDESINPGDVICVGKCQMAFVHDLSEAFPEAVGEADAEGKTVGPSSQSDSMIIDDTGAISDSNVMEPHGVPTITHRRGQTKYLRQQDEEPGQPRVGQAASTLCRLAFQLATESEPGTMADGALDGLFEGLSIDGGAVLVAPHNVQQPPTVADLEILASRARGKLSYQRLSVFVANTVLRDGEAVLARDIGDDSMLGKRDSKGIIHSTSVICAPVRYDNAVVGLIHLYSTDTKQSLDTDALEFTLAVADNVGQALRNLTREQTLDHSQREVKQLRSQLQVTSEIVGSSRSMAAVKEKIMQVAPERTTVLIRGESGVGKEVVARAVHYGGPRSKGPFVCLNCAALSETLLESELFGHEKGAFTGATERKVGKFEAADQGTLMLDEIGEMSPSIQAKFLRVLEGHTFERVGGNQAIKVDVRVIAATNRDLETAVSEGNFRRDLYFRLNVLEIEVSPLRKRPQDVLELAEFFLTQFNFDTGRHVEGFTSEAEELLTQYHWPGNVRELKNVVERAVVLTRNARLEVADLTLSNLATATESGEIPLDQSAYEPMSLADMEARHIAITLKQEGWNKSRTAGILGIERSTLDRKIRRYELNPPGV
ncbi:MAG: sigma 54-interacting transcriptional regulator [Pirellulaceae bacterium]